MEVLLTAPVNEISVVLGKFFASWIFYMILWIPWWLFLVSLRYVGHEEFDYRPLLSFNVALAFTGAGFMAMGLFFSSLTSNQIVAAVFTVVGMMAHLAFYFLAYFAGRSFPTVAALLNQVNFLDFWFEAAQGTLAPLFMIIHLSI